MGRRCSGPGVRLTGSGAQRGHGRLDHDRGACGRDRAASATANAARAPAFAWPDGGGRCGPSPGRAGRRPDGLLHGRLRPATSRWSQADRPRPERFQVLLVLRFFEGLDVTGAAKALGCSEGNVSCSLSRARSLDSPWGSGPSCSRGRSFLHREPRSRPRGRPPGPVYRRGVTTPRKRPADEPVLHNAARLWTTRFALSFAGVPGPPVAPPVRPARTCCAP